MPDLVVKQKQTAAQKTEIGGETFGSGAEAMRWLVLCDEQARGEIDNLARQPRFVLDESRIMDGKKERPVHYTADYIYRRVKTGEWVVEEMKGRKFADYPVRRRWFLQRYGELYTFIETSSEDYRPPPKSRPKTRRRAA